MFVSRKLRSKLNFVFIKNILILLSQQKSPTKTVEKAIQKN